jgi:hypothetical protein
MSNSTYDISAQQGSDYSVTLTYKDSNGAAVNLTGYTARMQVRRVASSPYVYLSLTSSSGMTLGGAAGTVAISIPAVALASIPAGAYVYDVELVSAGGAVVKPIVGSFTVSAEVTR